MGTTAGRLLRAVAGAALFAAGLAACGGGTPSVVNSGPSGPAATTSPTTAAPTTTTPTTTAPTGTAPPGGQHVTVTPDRGLGASATVRVEATGFSPHESLVVNECAAKAQATGPADCNLAAMQTVTSDASGHLVAEFTVVRGPFGANRVVCGPSQPCLVSVSQATFSPTEEASARIRFAS